MMYPEQFPKKKRKSDGNPRVRIDKDVYEYIDARAEEQGVSMAELLNHVLKRMVERQRQLGCFMAPTDLRAILNESNNDTEWWSPSQEASNDAAGT